ncbi:nucleoside hydrolase [Candidatus Roseilinea sp. NK_OTU-006]|uniref:nucleoside hydrolase n=1 Tax=Candidatus Roseilinea sp. NK_OTU-006 TaxID=2704250 RepID=UPI0021065FD8|nr:nucleoside hydrolase [Candidatus Roseilinea sp. NK_OTU-006]
MNRSRVLLDCDPGIDDALAILPACASPEIDLIGVTTVGGNALVEYETRNALAGTLHVPVAQGCARGLIKDLIPATWLEWPGLCRATDAARSTTRSDTLWTFSSKRCSLRRARSRWWRPAR